MHGGRAGERQTYTETEREGQRERESVTDTERQTRPDHETRLDQTDR